MLVSELAERADVPLATVKYYLREGLLPPAEVTGPRRTAYDDSHVRRLRLLRVLREVGGVPMTRLRQITEALDDETMSIHDVMTLTADVMSASPEPREQAASALEIVDEVIDRVGWDRLRPGSVDRSRLADLVTLLNGPGPLGADVGILSYYAGLADELARTEIGLIDTSQDRSSMLEQMVTGSVVFGQVFAVLRQMGHEHHHARAHDRQTARASGAATRTAVP